MDQFVSELETSSYYYPIGGLETDYNGWHNGDHCRNPWLLVKWIQQILNSLSGYLPKTDSVGQ